MSEHSIIDPELGALTWNDELEYWQGSIRLSSSDVCELVVFARSRFVADRAISADARRTIARLRTAEEACRAFACAQLLEIHNAEWSEGRVIDAGEFTRRLEPESVEVHESGYSEIHFRDGDLFRDHGVGVRMRPDGSFQEAVVEG